MTATSLALNTASCLTALAALCMSMGRHQGEIFGTRRSRRQSAILRAAGWSALAISFALAIRFDGIVFGPVHWLGSCIAAALSIVAVSSYRPRIMLAVFSIALLASIAVFVAIEVDLM